MNKLQKIGVAIIEHSGHVLLVKTLNRKYWEFPGGHVEPEEEKAEHISAAREAIEETGITAKPIHTFPKHKYEAERPKELHYYLCQLEQNNLPDPTPQASEIEDVKWVAIKEAFELVEKNRQIHPKIKKFFMAR